MEKRVNAGYEIIQSIQVGRTEFVLGVHQTVPDQFVTWRCTNQTEYDWGHYMENRLEATRSLCERALKEVRYLEQMQGGRYASNMTRNRNKARER